MTGISGLINQLSPVRTFQVSLGWRIHMRSYSDSVLLNPIVEEVFPNPLGDDSATQKTRRSCPTTPIRSSSTFHDEVDSYSIPPSNYDSNLTDEEEDSELPSKLVDECKEEDEKVSSCIFENPPLIINSSYPDHYTTETAAYFQPPTYCNVHYKSGYLKLKEIQDDELYTRVEVIHPIPKVTHIFHECVLTFPPSDCLVVMMTNEDLIGSSDRASSSSWLAQPLTRKCHKCDIPVCGTGGEDSIFYRYRVFCSDGCYNLYTMVERLTRDLALTPRPVGSPGAPDVGPRNHSDREEIVGADKGKGILYIG